MSICGGYIDRIEPETHQEDFRINSKIDLCFKSFDKYKEGFITFPCFELPLKKHKWELNKYVNMFWKYEINVTESGRNSLTQLINAVDSICDEFSTEEIQNNDIMFGIANSVLEKLNRKESDFSDDLDFSCEDEDSRVLLEKLHNINFPLSLLENFKSAWLLSDELALQIFIKYLQYLVIASLNNYEVTPWFWVDQLWHAHMTNTKHYRDTCRVIKETIESDLNHLNLEPQEFLPHLPADGSEESYSKLKDLQLNTELL